MKQITMLKLLAAGFACGVFGFAVAQTAPAAKAPAAAPAASKDDAAKKKAADAAKADAAKKGADAQAKAEDHAVANYKKNKGMAAAAPAKK